jgi:hypothetical protein
MSSAIQDVRENLLAAYNKFVDTTEPTWDTAIGIGAYADVKDGARVYSNLQGITKTGSAITAGVDKLVASGGGDRPEAQAYALSYIGDSANRTSIGWRAGAHRYICWFGDQPGHDPVTIGSNSYTFAGALENLLDTNIKVIAFSVQPSNKLDATGQATAITNGTWGATTRSPYLMTNVDQTGVINFIFKTINNDIPSG